MLFESDIIEEAKEVQEEEIQQEEAMEVDSDAETVNNNPPDQPEDSDSSYNESDSDLDISEVTLQRAIGFFAACSICWDYNAVKKCAVFVGAYRVFTFA